jgi:predicted permease
VALNWRMAGVAVGVVAATTLIFGLTPAWRASSSAPRAVAAGGSRVVESHSTLAASLIVVQVALSLALVVGAGLFARSLYNLRIVDRGFRNEGVLLASFDPTRAQLSPDALRKFNRDVLDGVRRLPAAREASLAAVTPLQGGGMSRPMIVNGVSTGEDEVYFNVVARGYFEIMGTPLLAGRDFTVADDDGAAMVAIVNEAFVRRYLRAGSVLGERVALSGPSDEVHIVGVVKDAAYESLRAAPPPTIYTSYLQHPGRRMTLVVDTPQPIAAAAALRAEVQPKVPAQPLRVRTLAAQVENSLIRERLLALLATVLGTLALTLAVVGLYGLVSYSVSSRHREFGVRLALGASHAAIQRYIVRQALQLMTWGILLGLPAAWMLSRLAGTLTFGVSPADPTVLSGAAMVLLVGGVMAAVGPARRAANVDPSISLRAE